jgi:DNA-binding response OmpR family regulator
MDAGRSGATLMATILVIDEYPHLQLLLKDELEEDGHRVLVTPSGFEALRLLDLMPVDLIISELETVDLSGLAVLEAVRKRNRYLPLIFHTANPVFRNDVMDSSADAWVVKSSDVGFLKAIVESTLNPESHSSGIDWPVVGNCVYTA